MDFGLLLTGLVAGMVLGISGVGAAAIMVVALAVAFQFGPAQSAGTALAALAGVRLVMAAATGGFSAAAFKAVRNVAGAGALGAIGGALATLYVLPTDWAQLDVLVQRVTGLALVLIGLYVVFWPDASESKIESEREAPLHLPSPSPAAFALGSGIIAGLSGLWSGMGLSLILPQDGAGRRGILLLAGAIVALAGSASHVALGNVQPAAALYLLLGALPGAVMGTALAAAYQTAFGVRRAGLVAEEIANLWHGH